MSGSIGIIGGTGPEGRGLAARFAHAGREVFLGSRSEERGQAAAREMAAASGHKIDGGSNLDAALRGETMIIALPYEGLPETLPALEQASAGKVVVSTVTPLRFSRGQAEMTPTQGGCAAEDIQLLLPRARVVAAFQHLAARKLQDVGRPLEADVIVCSDDRAAIDEIVDLARLIEGVRGVNGGALANSRYVEGLTALLVSINRIHRAETAIRVVGI